MEKRYYNAASLGQSLGAFEERFGVSSADFYAAYESGETLSDIPGFHRHVWASFYRDYRRLNGEDFSALVEHELELA